jgi:hypothetical protein
VTFRIPSSWRVFVLDDCEDRISWFRQRMPQAVFAKTSEAALEILSEGTFDAAFLDHDLTWMDAGFPERKHGNGKEVARFLAIRRFRGVVVIHSRSDQAEVMAKILPGAHVVKFGEFEISSAQALPQSAGR